MKNETLINKTFKYLYYYSNQAKTNLDIFIQRYYSKCSANSFKKKSSFIRE